MAGSWIEIGRRVCLGTVVACVLVVAGAPAAAAPWIPIGPEGGVVWGLGVDPTDPQVVYAGTSDSGIFKSRDGGRTWSLLAASFAGHRFPYQQILVDPVAPRHVYARTSLSELFKSADAGASWHRIGGSLPNGGQSAWDLDLDPSDPAHLLAATFDGPYESFDHGETWQPVADFPLDPYSPFPSRVSTGSLAVDPTNPRILYATTSPFGLLKSADGGASWAPAAATVSPDLIADAIVVAPGDPSRLYLHTGLGGLYRSLNGGVTWRRLQPGLDGVVTHLEADALDPGLLYAVVFEQGLFRSTSGGLTWSRIDQGISGGIHAFGRHPLETAILLAGSDDGPWRSSDGGASWQLHSGGLTARLIRAVAAVPGEAAAVLAATDDGAILRREEAGGPWRRVYPRPPAPVRGPYVASLAVSPVDPSRVYAAAGYSLLESRDGSLTWRSLPPPDLASGAFFFGLVPDPGDPAVLYTAGVQIRPYDFDPGVLLKSTDGGGTWVDVNPGPEIYVAALAVEPGAPDTIYAGSVAPSSQSWLRKSSDGGETWSDLSSRFPGGAAGVLSLVFDASSRPHRLYAGLQEGGVARSTDGGESWAVAAALPAGPVVALVLGPGTPALLYAAVSGQGVFASADGGLAWRRVGEGLPAAVGGLASLPTTPTTLFAAAPSGVYRSADGGCAPEAATLCLQGGRFQVEVDWRLRPGRAGAGRALPLTGDTGAFWFFDRDDLELAVKVLDGRAVNGRFWVFYGGLTNVAFRLRVTDTATGTTRTYDNPRGHFASRGDTEAFAGGTEGDGGPSPPAALARPRSGSALTLLGDRFRVEAAWTDARGRRRSARALPLTGDTGAFWFASEGNLELLVKVHDGRAVNGHIWLFYASLSNLGFEITVTDTETGARRTYRNPAGSFASRGDTQAF